MICSRLNCYQELVAFEDDAGLVITGKTLEKIQRIFGECYGGATVDGVSRPQTG